MVIRMIMGTIMVTIMLIRKYPLTEASNLDSTRLMVSQYTS